MGRKLLNKIIIKCFIVQYYGHYVALPSMLCYAKVLYNISDNQLSWELWKIHENKSNCHEIVKNNIKGLFFCTVCNFILYII